MGGNNLGLQYALGGFGQTFGQSLDKYGYERRRIMEKRADQERKDKERLEELNLMTMGQVTTMGLEYLKKNPNAIAPLGKLMTRMAQPQQFKSMADAVEWNRLMLQEEGEMMQKVKPYDPQAWRWRMGGRGAQDLILKQKAALTAKMIENAQILQSGTPEQIDEAQQNIGRWSDYYEKTMRGQKVSPPPGPPPALATTEQSPLDVGKWMDRARGLAKTLIKTPPRPQGEESGDVLLTNEQSEMVQKLTNEGADEDMAVRYVLQKYPELGRE